jgi:RNA polymerase sigma-70 factor, ECF subfamily
MTLLTETTGSERLSDGELVERVLRGEKLLFELLMRKYNQRLFRACRAILRDDAEAEDVAQDAYVRAYEHLSQFEGRASFSTWLTRIAVNEALARRRRRQLNQEIDAMQEVRKDAFRQLSNDDKDPEQLASSAETRTFLEQSIDALPDSYREVFVLREVEEMSTSETADTLEISEENVKTRLHRARALLRRELFARAGATSTSAFHFLGARCDRLIRNVMARIEALPTINQSATSRDPLRG